MLCRSNRNLGQASKYVTIRLSHAALACQLDTEHGEHFPDVIAIAHQITHEHVMPP